MWLGLYYLYTNVKRTELMNTKNILWGVLVILVVLVGGFLFMRPSLDTQSYPNILPSNFSATVDNPYFTLVPGTKFTYEAKKAEGTERIEVTVLRDTRKVMGVETRVVRDQVFLNGSLVEDTLDWYAQDKEGSVWYFGEDTAEYEDGVLTSHHGAWEAGVDGALPGIVMKTHPKVGDSYYQEYYAGEAEDKADVLSVNETVTVPKGTYVGCVKTFDYTPLDLKSLEHKFYCKEVGFTVLEIDTTDEERVELISVETGVETLPAVLTPSKEKPVQVEAPPPGIPDSGSVPTTSAGGGASGAEAPAKITEAEAKEIALTRVPGVVTDIAIEAPFDKPLYVVEIKPAGGGAEVDVSIDMQTGAVLSVED